MAVSERSPPDRSEIRFTRLRPGLASISIPLVSGSAGSVSTSRPSPPGKSSPISRSNCMRDVAVRGRERLGDLLVDLATTSSRSRRALRTSSSSRGHEVVPFLERLELAGREQVHPAEQGEPPLDELGSLLERLDRVVVAERGHELVGVGLMPLPEQPLGLADPALDVTARAVLLVVALAQPVELGGRVAPGLVDRGLAFGASARSAPAAAVASLGRRGGGLRRPGRRPPRRRRAPARRPRASARSCHGIVGGELVALGAERVRAARRGSARSRRRVSTVDAGWTGGCGGRRQLGHRLG